MKFSIKDLVAFTEEILNGKLYFLCSVIYFGHIVCYTEVKKFIAWINHLSRIRRFSPEDQESGVFLTRECLPFSLDDHTI